MSYGLVLVVATIALPVIFVLATRASSRLKIAVVIGAVLGFAVPWPIAGTILRLAVSLFVLLYLKAYPLGSQRA